jgi:uncharacterized LabA/DUF88 family protein
MASSPDNISMAVFCDFENVALGVRDANYDKFDIKPILERLLLKGSITVKKAYCDWERYKGFKATMHEANFELIEIPHVRQSGKNSADIRLVVDALDLCYTKSHVNTFVIISGDSDFSPLVSKLRENDKKVIGVGVKQSTSDLLVAGCDEFIFYDDLVREIKRAAAKRDERKVAPTARRSPDEGNRRKEEIEARKAQAIDLVVEMFDALVSERGDSGKIWASLLKDTLKRRRPDFNETYYGFRTFGNLLEEAQNRGMLEFGRDEKSGAYVYRSSNAQAAAPAVQGEQGEQLAQLESIEQDEPADQPPFDIADEQDEGDDQADADAVEAIEAQGEQPAPREAQPQREQQAPRNEGGREGGREGRESRRRGGRGRNKGGEQRPVADAVARDIGGDQADAAPEIDEDEALDIAYLARATAKKAAQDKHNAGGNGGNGGGNGGGQNNKRSGGRPAPQDKRANKPASQDSRRDGRPPRDERKPAARSPYRPSGPALSQVEQEQAAYAAQEVARELAQEKAAEAAARAAERTAQQQQARAPKAPQPAPQAAPVDATPVAQAASGDAAEAPAARAKPARKPAAPKAAKAKAADLAPVAAPVVVAEAAPAKAAKPARAKAVKPAAAEVEVAAKPAAAAKKPAAPKAKAVKAAPVEAAPVEVAAKPARKPAARKPAKAAA